MTSRYFVEPPITGETATLAGPEAHHLIHVMRAKPGSEVILFDGSGAEFNARIERIARSGVELTILSREEVDRELALDVTLAAPLPKGDRQRWLVEKAVELGLRQLVPLATERSVARSGRQAVDRLRRTVIEACKQCGRNRLMAIAQPQEWPDFVAATQTASCRLFAHPEGATSQSGQTREASLAAKSRRTGAVALAVGPEGGFTSHEVALATSAGWQSIDLGPRVLRAETAAFLLVAMVVQDAQKT